MRNLCKRTRYDDDNNNNNNNNKIQYNICIHINDIVYRCCDSPVKTNRDSNHQS